VRFVPAILRNGRHTHRGSIQGQPTDAALSRAIDTNKQAIPMREDGLILSTTLAAKLDIRAGDMVTVEVRNGRRPTLALPVAAIADSFFGTPAFIELGALNRALKEPGRVTGAYLRIDPGKRDEITQWLKGLPMVAGVSIKAEAETAFRKVMNEGAGSSRYVMGVLAFVITYGIVYNAARIAHAERARDLASLRVLGFTKGEAAFVLLGELAVITLVALPIGTLLGHGLSQLIMAAFSTDIYTITLGFEPSAYGNAALVVLSAALVSGLLVKRDLDRADLISALKTRE
jgi:putative ABC transport system permease protein